MSVAFLRGKPKSAQALVEAIERAIGDGTLRRDDRLPPVRELADATGLAANTVASAYRTLNQRGVVVGRGRAGTFIAGRPPLVEAAAPLVPAGVRDLSLGSPDPALLPPLGEILRSIDPTPVLYGAPTLDDALAPWAARWATPENIPVERVAIVGGALDGVERVLSAHARTGDRVAVEDPGYAAVFDLLAALGLVAVPVPIDGEGMQPDALRRALRHGVAATVCTPRGQNPTGCALSAARQHELQAVLADHPEVVIIEDDHAGPVAGAPRRTLVTTDRAHWASIASVAKSLGPDLRLAFLAGDRVTLDRVEGRQQLGTGWVSHLLQRCVAAMLRDEADAGRLTVAAAHYAARRRALIEALAEHGVAAVGDSGLNVWVPVAAEEPVVTNLAQRGWWVRPGARFRIDTAPAVRITVATLEPAEIVRLAADIAAVTTQAGPRRRLG